MSVATGTVILSSISSCSINASLRFGPFVCVHLRWPRMLMVSLSSSVLNGSTQRTIHDPSTSDQWLSLYIQYMSNLYHAVRPYWCKLSNIGYTRPNLRVMISVVSIDSVYIPCGHHGACWYRQRSSMMLLRIFGNIPSARVYAGMSLCSTGWHVSD